MTDEQNMSRMYLDKSNIVCRLHHSENHGHLSPDYYRILLTLALIFCVCQFIHVPISPRQVKLLHDTIIKTTLERKVEGRQTQTVI